MSYCITSRKEHLSTFNIISIYNHITLLLVSFSLNLVYLILVSLLHFNVKAEEEFYVLLFLQHSTQKKNHSFSFSKNLLSITMWPAVLAIRDSTINKMEIIPALVKLLFTKESKRNIQ